MSWDVMIFSLKQKIASIGEIEEEQFIPVDFGAILESYFKNVSIDGDHRTVRGDNYSIEYFIDEEPTGNTVLQLYGENALFELIAISKKHGWQIYDTGNGEMLDLDHPEKNGYNDFQAYSQQIRGGNGADNP